MHLYEIYLLKDKRSVDLISDALKQLQPALTR